MKVHGKWLIFPLLEKGSHIIIEGKMGLMLSFREKGPNVIVREKVPGVVKEKGPDVIIDRKGVIV